MKALDRLKHKIKIDKNLTLFLFILGLTGIIAGSIFVTILNDSDKALINEHLNVFLNNIENNKLDYIFVLKNNMITNIFYILIIWLLGISIIGLPILLIIFFSKTFILGFSIGSIISCFKLKGALFSLAYIFPGNVIGLIAISIITMYAMTFSIKLIYAIFKKKTIDFKILINKYSAILFIVLGIIILTSLYDTFIMPNIVKLIIPIIK